MSLEVAALAHSGSYSLDMVKAARFNNDHILDLHIQLVMASRLECLNGRSNDY